jgi:type VII secretion system (Wss) protein ESAT-6
VAVDDLPLPVVNFLNVIGVPWPYIDEDQVTQFAAFVREFATAVQTTHDDATRAVADIAAAYRGSATDAMTSGWTKLSARHVDELIDGCHILAGALDVAAGYIVAQKAEAIAVLIGMAAAFVADQAAAVATAGLAEAAVPLIIEGAERVVKSLVMDLEQHIIGEVVEAAARPLFGKLEDALSGLDWSRSGAQAGATDGISLDAEAAFAHIAKLRSHAETLRGHGEQFSSAIAGLGF